MIIDSPAWLILSALALVFFFGAFVGAALVELIARSRMTRQTKARNNRYQDYMNQQS